MSLGGSVGNALLSSYLTSCCFACGVRVEYPYQAIQDSAICESLKIIWEGRGLVTGSLGGLLCDLFDPSG